MNKDILKRLIIENQEFLKNIACHNRSYSLEPNANYVITGPRRAGKSYFLFDTIQCLFSSSIDYTNILYINFEDERLIEMQSSNLDLLLQCYSELYAKKPILILDEIQNVSGWEKFARRLADTNYRVYVTGSNAKMLSNEIATVLGGRFFVKEIQPLSFFEYLKFNNIEYDSNFEYSPVSTNIISLFNRYLQFGGFPEVINFQNPKEYLNNLYLKVFYGDIVARNSIKNEYAMRILVKKIAESVCNETSYNRLKNIVSSIGIPIGTSTIIDYTKYMDDSFLIRSIPNFLHKFSERESKRKFFFLDNGILQIFLTEQPQKLLENLVYSQLYRKYKDEIYYIQKDFEADFYIPEEKLVIQVCMDMSNFDTQKREINSLKKAMKLVDSQNGLIITLYEKAEISSEIRMLPAWQWLLQ